MEALGFEHVVYEEARIDWLERIADEVHIHKVYDSGEKIVKCKIISSEETSIVPWEDFQVYCRYHDKNEYDLIRKKDPDNFYRMQLADYILGNEDRHGANFGFFMNNQTGELLNLYPLMDHDHAFSNDENIPSQTSEHDETLQEAAMKAVAYVDVDYDKVLEMQWPEEVDEQSWSKVLERCSEIQMVGD